MIGPVCETISDVNVQRIREDNFERLLDTYAPALKRLCSAHRRDPRDRQDLFQEIAVALWTALPRFRADSSERTWLYRIAHNVALTDSARRQSKRRREVQIDEHPPPPDSSESPRRAELLDAVCRLEPVDGELALLYLEGLTTREIGDVLGITEGNAGVRLTRMRQRLTQMLNPQEKEAAGT
jgi:RNA polymerase sigma factor (sigma-70 family)